MKEKYFVIGFRKIKTSEEYKNKIVGHNHRTRNYNKNPHLNINPDKTKDNIILQDLKYKSASQLIEAGNKRLAKGKRKLKKNSAFAFEIIVDCTPNKTWTQQHYIDYLLEAEKFLKERFRGQEVVSSVIHLDESKPHLHIVFSYFNEDLGKWNQRSLMQQKKTNLNNLLKDFEERVGKKFGLVKGKGKEISKPLKKELSKHVKTIKEKKFLFFSLEKKVIEAKDAIKAVKNISNKHKKAIYENQNLKKQLDKRNKKIAELATINEKLKEENEELQEQKNKFLEAIKRVKELEKKLKEKNAEIKQLEQALLREREKRLGIKSELPQKTIQQIKKDYGISK
jgi:vacuolar-type H+-ATPase subunit I/STV1